MIVKQTVVFPTEDSIELLQQQFQGCTFNIEWNNICVELNCADVMQSVPEDTNRVFSAIPDPTRDISMISKIYNTEYGSTSVYVLLNSPEMSAYSYFLKNKNGYAFHPIQAFYFRLVDGYHNNRLHNGFLNSVADTWSETQPTFTFSRMTTRVMDIDSDDNNFYDVLNMY